MFYQGKPKLGRIKLRPQRPVVCQGCFRHFVDRRSGTPDQLGKQEYCEPCVQQIQARIAKLKQVPTPQELFVDDAKLHIVKRRRPTGVKASRASRVAYAPMVHRLVDYRGRAM